MTYSRVRSLLLVAASLCVACGSTPADEPDGAIDATALDAPAADAPALDGAADDAAIDAPTVDAPSPDDAGAADAGDDSSTSFPDSGLPDPEWSDLEVGPLGACAEFVACGGDVVGVWDLAGGCFEVDVEAAIARCPGASVTERSGRGRGRVVFGADGTAHRVAESVLRAGINIPAICTAVVSCDAIEAAIAGSATTASCTSAATGDCDCIATYVTTIDNRSIYSIEGNEIVAPLGKRWEYCIEGDDFAYVDTSPSGTREPGTVELRRN